MKKLSSLQQAVIIIAAIIFLLGTTAKLCRAFKPKKNDFAVYYLTSQRVVAQDWAHIYTRDDGTMPFRYAPYMIPTISWLSFLEMVTAKKTWMIIQSLFYLFGYLYLYKSLRILKIEKPLFILALTFILTSKYYIDSIFCGQISGIMFYFFSMGLFYWLREETGLGTFSQFFPTTLKIVPGIVLIQNFVAAKNVKKCLQIVGFSTLFFAISNLLFLLWLKSKSISGSIFDLFIKLWKGWAEIVMADGQYVDSTTNKSQSLNSFILRTFGVNETSAMIWKISFVIILLIFILNWAKTNPKKPIIKAYSYALSILGFIILMPQAFPYTLSNLALPLSLVLCTLTKDSSRFHKTVIAAFVLFLTIPCADIIGYERAQWVLKHSFPLIGITMMTCFIYRETWVDTKQTSKTLCSRAS